MAYYVRSLPLKKSYPQWKLQFVSYRREIAKNPNTRKPKREWDVPHRRWQALGFNDFMTITEARARAEQLNAQRHVKRQELLLRKIELQKKVAQKKYDAFLPSEFVAEFEERFIRKRDSQTERGVARTTRAYVTWNAAQKMIIAVGVDPSEWFYSTYQIYDYFHEQKFSLKYLSSVVKIANLWGFYFSRRLARPFLPIPQPHGYERQRLLDAHQNKIKGGLRPSLPLTPKDLENVSDEINVGHFNWIYLSVWFGLRPSEVDCLQLENFWRIEDLKNGKKVLWVYQTKMTTIADEDRWKPIPLLFQEQFRGLEIVRSRKFKRPLPKTMSRYFGPGFTLYAGRKGFTDLMLSKGFSIENISIWMGHATIDRTWRSYKQRRKFHLAGF